jgi:hypothetical protein
LSEFVLAVDWWARGLGLLGALAGVGVFAWRIFEWNRENRIHVEVRGSAGVWHISGGQYSIYRGPYLQATHVTVSAVNKGRDVTLEQFGYRIHTDGRVFVLTGMPGQLPKRLSRGESETVVVAVSEAIEMAARRRLLEPYVKDSEGNVHVGKLDDHFARFSRGDPPLERPDPVASLQE